MLFHDPKSDPIASPSQLKLRCCINADGVLKLSLLEGQSNFGRLTFLILSPEIYTHSAQYSYKTLEVKFTMNLPSSSLHSLTMQRDSTSSTRDEKAL